MPLCLDGHCPPLLPENKKGMANSPCPSVFHLVGWALPTIPTHKQKGHGDLTMPLCLSKHEGPYSLVAMTSRIIHQNKRATDANNANDAATCWPIWYSCSTFEV